MICNKCNIDKDFSQFTKRPNGKYHSGCKACHTKRNMSNYYKKNPIIIIEDLDGEIWKDVLNYEGEYKVSNLGRIKRLAKIRDRKDGRRLKIGDKLVSTDISRDGYVKLSLIRNYNRKTASIHRLIAQAFIPNTENKPQVNHKNGIRDDNRIENLEWCTISENIRHSYDVLGKIHNCTGKLNRCSKPIVQMDIHGKELRRWPSAKQVQRELGYCTAPIYACCKGEGKTAYKYKWKHDTNK